MIKRVIVSNFRSLGENVVVELGPLTALVGVNSGGKSSVADVLQFVADCLNRGLDVAMTRRGGINALRRAGGGPEAAIHIRVEVESAQGTGFWEFSLGGGAPDEYRVLSESSAFHRGDPIQVSDIHLVADLSTGEGPSAMNARDMVHSLLDPWFLRREDKLTGSLIEEIGRRPTDPSTLLLERAPSPGFSPLINALKGISIYNIFPSRLREPQTLDLARPMREHGENWASVLRNMDKDSQGRELLSALGHIAGDIDDYRTTAVGGFVIPEFRHRAEDGSTMWLGASQESNGMLRMAGILTALLQEPPLTLVGIEEPELIVHPSAIGVLVDHLRKASTRGQVLLTTHSKELLDLLDPDEIRVVERHGHVTTVARADEARRSLVKKR